MSRYNNDDDFFEDDDFEFQNGDFEPPESRDGLMLGIMLGAGVGVLLLLGGVVFFLLKNDDPSVAPEGGVAQTDSTQQNDQNQGDSSQIANNNPPTASPINTPQDKPSNSVNNVRQQNQQPDTGQGQGNSPAKPENGQAHSKPDGPMPPKDQAKPNNQELKPSPIRPAPKDIKPGIPGQRIAYKWNQGDIHAYQLTMTAETPAGKQTINGTVDLTVGSPVAAKPAEQKVEPDEGSGTGFVATADGYIITCEHVVDAATSIEVTVEGQKYRAVVVAKDPANDLAVLKIDAKGLHPLPLANVKNVELAQDVRVIGYPLSSILGDNLKITAGVVSGIVQREGQRRFQIDAAISPGNSGGPVVNLRGQVVGVASSKLVGDALENVGFCVPCDLVQGFIQDNKLTVDLKGGAADDLNGPDLVKRVRPSLAFIKVQIDPRKTLGQLVQLNTSGSFSVRNNNAGRRVINFGPSVRSTHGFVKVDQFGQVSEFKDANQLPFLTGPMSLLAMHALDPKGRNQWTIRNGISIAIEKEDPRFGGFPRGPRGFGPRFRFPDPFGRNERNIEKHQAMEEHRYVLKKKTDKTLTISKLFSLKTLDNPKRPLMSIQGTGTITFNLEDGMVEHYEFEQAYEGNDDNGQRVVIPINISMKRISPDVLADRIRKSADTIALSEAQRAATAKAKADPQVVAQQQKDRLDALVAKCKSGKGGWVDFKGMSEIAFVKERQAEVEEALLHALEGIDKKGLGSKTPLQYILKALGKWGSKKSVPAIIPMLMDDFFTVPQAASNALGQIGDESAIDPIVESMIANKRNRRHLTDGLKKFGPQVEDKMIELLTHEDRSIAETACEVLKGVGGKKSIEALTPIAKSKDFFRRVAADRTLKPIKQRVDLEGDVPTDPSSSPALRRIDSLIAQLNKPEVKDFDRIQLVNKLIGESVIAERKEAVEAELIKMLESSNPSLQLQAVIAIKKWATPKSVPVLAKLAVEKPSLAINALDALGTAADKSISNKIAELALQPKTRLMAMAQLKKIGLNATAEEKLSNALPNAEPPLKTAIIEVLGLHGSPACLKSLEPLANAEKPTTLMKAAATAAARIRLRGDSLKDRKN